MAGDRQAILPNNKYLSPPGLPDILKIHLLFLGQPEPPKVRRLQSCEDLVLLIFDSSPQHSSWLLHFLLKTAGRE